MSVSRVDRCIRIADLSETTRGNVSRVSANVEGDSIWFETRDAALHASPEAYASLLLIPALHRGARLELDVPLDPTWLDHTGPLLDVFARWWRLPRLRPTAPLRATPHGPAAEATALCFSAGIDSFDALLSSGEPISKLVTVQGFDIALDDTPRMDALSASLGAIAAETGIPSIIVRTNMRSHPLIQPVPWERAHGGALAALGHVLGATSGRLIIASSVQIGDWLEPWGSHWEVDPLWSSSSVEIVHYGADRARTRKLAAIADHPLVQHHLRVCWENRTPTGNCSSCEKCLSTMLKLVELGRLDRFSVFEHSDDLAERIDALPRIKSLPRAFGELARSDKLPPHLSRAVRDLQRRTRRARSPLRRLLLGARRSWNAMRGLGDP
jgi:hypothetical protein